MAPALIFDAHGFPYVRLRGPTAVGLLPVLKAQFEIAYGAPGGTEVLDYPACLRANPRGSWRRPAAGTGPLYLTGVLAAEARAAGQRFGPGSRLATAEEWQEADALLDRPLDPATLAKLLAADRLHPAAAAVIGRTRAATWREIGEGLLEWVQAPAVLGLYGRPRPEYRLNLLLNPRIHPPVVPRGAERHPAYGLRLAIPHTKERRSA
ncbi:hypothetical protein [Fimbriiglobus ruber]|uniref:Uncharacterized protein n=1 Tax=Fimbriiglobus ruber TaxID=1908690 RepID=A0A225DD54_9BACT|nr:hypothetical protein [Fimbriiglobus ruber]OWK36458.1 hypothetical protein FRUB_09021 [Fimbriiglobus ruber]